LKQLFSYFIFLIALSNFAQAPGGVSNNCVFWVKADDLALNTSDSVLQWNDACGQGNDATQPNVINQPTYNEVVQNYNPGVYFNGNDQYLNMDNLIDANSTTIDIFAVGTNELGANDFNSMVFGQGESQWSSGGYCLCTMNSDQTQFGFWVNELQFRSEVGWFGGSNMPSRLLEGKYDGSEINFYLDAGDSGSFTYTGVIGNSNSGSGTTHLGGGDSTANSHKGHISEVIIYSDALSDADRNKINSYLAIKYGIEGINRGGIADNIVDSNGQSLFADASGDYWNGIIGIGRDDASALHQKQSHLRSDITRIYLENIAVDNEANTGGFDDGEFVIMGDNRDVINPLTVEQNEELPAPLFSRIEREWKITNTNFDDIFNVDIRLTDCVDISQLVESDLRLLVDSDGDFSNATIYQSGDDGLSIVIDGEYVKILNISNTHIDVGATQYITIASAEPILLNILIDTPIDDFYECDTDDDGMEVFTIDESALIAQVIGTQTEIDTVEFFDENGDSIDLTNITVIAPLQTITVVVTHNQGCYIEDEFDLVVLSVPVLDVIDPNTLIECSNFTLPQIMGANLSGNQAYYTFPDGTEGNGGNNPSFQEGDILSFDDFPSYPVTLYVFDGVESINCFDEQSFQLIIESTPDIDEIDDVMICGEYILPVITGTNLTGNEAYYTEQDGGGTQYFAGEILSFIDFLVYPVTLYLYDSIDTGTNFCFDEESFELTIYNSLDFELTESNLIIDFIGNLEVINIGPLNYEYAVDNQNFQASNMFSGIEEGIHTLYVRDENNCVVKSIEFEMIIIYTKIPKFFTPNGDSFNDSWIVIDNLHTMDIIHIFDRFGKVVAKIQPNGNGWDGNFNGKPLFRTDYWYKIELLNGKEIKGHFSLSR